jgi:hypothetical protein
LNFRQGKFKSESKVLKNYILSDDLEQGLLFPFPCPYLSNLAYLSDTDSKMKSEDSKKFLSSYDGRRNKNYFFENDLKMKSGGIKSIQEA